LFIKFPKISLKPSLSLCACACYFCCAYKFRTCNFSHILMSCTSCHVLRACEQDWQDEERSVSVAQKELVKFFTRKCACLFTFLPFASSLFVFFLLSFFVFSFLLFSPFFWHMEFFIMRGLVKVITFTNLIDLGIEQRKKFTNFKNSHPSAPSPSPRTHRTPHPAKFPQKITLIPLMRK